ncbi:hypothetical protein [Metapseudomonas otitidis]|uniref:hypothetical protein n=1 Tax=Metapseudomonas otitidis TaxID=319939 RepID=UPI001600A979|nr:hypothetical protein [Pseudomonas otitidis]
MVEEDVRALFNDRFLPAFKNEYPAMGNTDFYIDETNQDIDGAGSPGLVMVTQGACQQADYLVLFAIAHETAHGVVALEHARQGTHCPEAMDAGRKKHEAWADLIATKVLLCQLPDLWASVAANIDLIPNILGPATPSHPSGARRVELIKNFVTAYTRAGIPASRSIFSCFFCCVSKPISTTQAKARAFRSAFLGIETAQL